MKKEIEQAAKNVGITAIITNSERKIETQLNKLTDLEDLPILLVSWDYETTLSFDEHGMLNNPVTNIVCLLMTKADSKEKVDMENAAEQMGYLFTGFVRELNNILKFTTRDGSNGMESISYMNAPFYGMGKHSGVLGRFTMKTEIIDNCVNPKECDFVQPAFEEPCNFSLLGVEANEDCSIPIYEDSNIFGYIRADNIVYTQSLGGSRLGEYTNGDYNGDNGSLAGIFNLEDRLNIGFAS